MAIIIILPPEYTFISVYSGGFCYGRKDKPTSPPAGFDEPGQGQRDGNSGRSGF